MPKYRQLHTKIVDSFDFAEMPNDFIRLFWLLLIVIVDSEGRGIDNPAWIRSRMFPLRPDIDIEEIEAAMEWLAKRQMIRRYQVDGRRYFDLPTFHTYQSGTDKEARSTLPACPDLLQSNSGVAPEEVCVNTIQYNAEADAEASAKRTLPPASVEIPTTPKEALSHPEIIIFQKASKAWPGRSDYKFVIDSVQILRPRYETDEACIEDLSRYAMAWQNPNRKTKDGKPYKITNPGWLEWAINKDIPPIGINGKSAAPSIKWADEVKV